MLVDRSDTATPTLTVVVPGCSIRLQVLNRDSGYQFRSAAADGGRLCTVANLEMPMGSEPSPRLIRFGVFELDLRSGELQRQGRKIRLEGQPVQVLICLLENPGELVTREELHRKLWPTDTFVNFEHGLNAAVKRLRQALNDAADNPRFVETLPRRGYRFIAPIQAVTAIGDESPADATAAITEVPAARHVA